MSGPASGVKYAPRDGYPRNSCTFKLPAPVYSHLRYLAEVRCCTLNAVICQLVEEAYDKYLGNPLLVKAEKQLADMCISLQKLSAELFSDSPPPFADALKGIDIGEERSDGSDEQQTVGTLVNCPTVAPNLPR